MKPNILIWKNTATFDPNRLGTGSKKTNYPAAASPPYKRQRRQQQQQNQRFPPTLAPSAAARVCTPIARGANPTQTSPGWLLKPLQTRLGLRQRGIANGASRNGPKCCAHWQSAQGQAPLWEDSPSVRGSPDFFHQPNSWLRTGTFQELILVLLHHHQQTLRN